MKILGLVLLFALIIWIGSMILGAIVPAAFMPVLAVLSIYNSIVSE